MPKPHYAPSRFQLIFATLALLAALLVAGTAYTINLEGAPTSQGSLIERGGPFLNDGDTVILRGYAGETVGFGELINTIHASPSL